MGVEFFPIECGAAFSDCRLWRYRLWRIWDTSLPYALFIMMNPSIADEVQDDPTVHRCQKRVQFWKKHAFNLPECGGVVVCNAFAWRETDSRKLPGLIKNGIDIVGPENDTHIMASAFGAGVVVCGWGNPGNLLGRGQFLLTALKQGGIPVYALTQNQDGTPGHPLYIGYDKEPMLCR